MNEACQGIHDYLMQDLEGQHAFFNSAKTLISISYGILYNPKLRKKEIHIWGNMKYVTECMTI